MSLLRSLVFLIWMYGLLFIMGLLWLPALFLPRAALVSGIRVYARLIRWGLRMICGVRTEFRGLEKLPPGPILYAAKHQCMWDVFVPFLILQDPVITMKRELIWYPFLGWYALRLKMIAIDRGGSAKTVKKMLNAAQERAREGRQFVIFPEGTRHPPGITAGYFAAGTSAFYKKLGVQCVPVATNSGLCWPARGIVRKPGTIVFEVLDPIEPGLDRRALMSRLETAIEPASAALLEEGLAVQGRTREDLELA
ncbi:MAG: 1-acyl-sn-glycerol-3-phosphate acyltransferase [Hyphomonadaceae bacterium]|nr:1-acyl-sn-glycerol-3-phosphate acyltransferase [Hyphomonadaceae bacterium]